MERLLDGTCPLHLIMHRWRDPSPPTTRSKSTELDSNNNLPRLQRAGRPCSSLISRPSQRVQDVRLRRCAVESGVEPAVSRLTGFRSDAPASPTVGEGVA